MKTTIHHTKLQLAMGILGAALADAPHAQEITVNFDISPQPASSALITFGEQAGITVLINHAARDVQLPGLKGAYRVDEAIQLLLKDVKLSYKFDNEGIIVSPAREEKAKKKGTLFSVMMGALAAAFTSGAVTAEEEVTSVGSGPQMIEEIIVTAQKREQNLQDVPVAVSALTTADIEKQGIENFEDFARQLPGVNLIQPRQNRSQFIIRGITTGQAGGRSQDEVATYIDDISVTSSYFAFVLPDLRLFDIERVEVLRGPQGTLFGSGSLGGAVRVITNKPDTTEFDTAVLVDGGYTKGGGARQRYSGMVNLPLVEDKVAVRAVGYYRDEEGYVDNIGTGKDKANSTLDKGGRIAVQWTPTDRLTASFMVLAQDSDPEDSDQFDPSLGRHKKNSVFSDKLISELRIYNATIDYDLSFASLTSSTTVAKSVGDSFGGFNFITDLISNVGQDSKFTAEEIKLVSQTDGPYEWVVGAYYFDQKADHWEFADIKDSASFGQQFNVTGLPSNGRIVEFSNNLEAQERALFGEISYRLDEQFTLTGGLRYSRSDMRFLNRGIARFGGFVTAALNGGGDINDVPPAIFDQDVNADSSVLTGKASISYQPSENRTYYLLASRGYRVGQANSVFGPDPIDPANGLNIPGQFEPDILWNYEFGAKTVWLDGRFLANIAVFYIPWKNIQVNGTRQTDFSTFTGNAGKAISKGIELETLFWPVEALQLGLNITLQDAEVTDISAQDSAVTGVLEDDKLPNSPDFQVAGFAEYSWSIRNDWRMFTRLDVQYVDSTVNGFSNTAGAPGVPNPVLAETDDYENVNASFGVETEAWNLTFYAENLTDNDEYIYISPALGTANKYNTLRPRTLGMRLKYSY